MLLCDSMGCRQNHFTSPAIVTLPFYCQGKKRTNLPFAPTPTSLSQDSQGLRHQLCPLVEFFLHLPLSPVPTLERHSPAALH